MQMSKYIGANNKQSIIIIIIIGPLILQVS